MIRRAALVAAVTLALGLVTGSADASSQVVVPRGDTNGCVVVKPAQIAVCIGRL